MSETCNTHAYSILVGTPEGKRPLWRRGLRSRGNIKIYLKEMEFNGVD
jgi:hypothetical protein